MGQLSQDGECCQNCLGLHSHRTGAVGKKLSFLAAFALSFLPRIFPFIHYILIFSPSPDLPCSRQQSTCSMQDVRSVQCPALVQDIRTNHTVSTPAVVHGLDILGMWSSKTSKSRETVGFAQTHLEHSWFLTFSNPC